MPIVQPPTERHLIQDDGYSLLFTIPSRKNYFTIFFLGFWLIGWAIGEIMVGGILITSIIGLLFNSLDISKFGASGFTFGGIFIIAWIGLWTIGGGFAIYTLLWQLTGNEKIMINNDMIKIKRVIFGIGRENDFLSSDIKDLRVTTNITESNYFGWSRNSNIWNNFGGPLAFDYGSKTYHFGSGVDEAEAKHILENITTRFPYLRKNKSDLG